MVAGSGYGCHPTLVAPSKLLGPVNRASAKFPSPARSSRIHVPLEQKPLRAGFRHRSLRYHNHQLSDRTINYPTVRAPPHIITHHAGTMHRTTSQPHLKVRCNSSSNPKVPNRRAIYACIYIYKKDLYRWLPSRGCATPSSLKRRFR